MLKIGKNLIGEGHPCYITFELGPTHKGLESAKRLVKSAYDAGADAVKVQIFDPEKLVSDKTQLFKYSVLKAKGSEDVVTVEEPLYDILKRRCMKTNEWRELKHFCDQLGIAFFSTVGFEEDVELLESLRCDSIKIASADVNHFPLLRRVAKTGMCVQLDTGMASIGEIEKAVDIILSEGNDRIIIHQCPSGYPARLESVNLRIIETLKKMFPFPVAFSDHTPGRDMDIAAVALGANLVEKTITEDRATPSVEHIMSLEPEEMKHFVQAIRDVEIGMGSYRRRLQKDELVNRKYIRRSVYLTESAFKGQQLKDCKLEFRRPGFGLTPDQYDLYKDSVLARNVEAGEVITVLDLTRNHE